METSQFTSEELVEEYHRRIKEGGCVKRFFSTPEDRVAYEHWLRFFDAGRTHKERLALCANQVGKSTGGLFEVTLHLTGDYPTWWTGKRFDGANDWWICGVTQSDVQTILQERLLGPVGEFGTGFIPKDRLDFTSLKDAKKTGTSVGTFRVRHVSGGWSNVTFKSYEQGRESFQGKPGISIMLDEEPPLAVYTEAFMRTIAADGLMILTFTPLKGISDTVMNFLGDNDISVPSGTISPSRYIHRATWDDAPHLTKENKEALLAQLPPFQRDARTKGIPTLGAGAIFSVSEDIVFIDPFEIPKHWKKCYGMDVGWKVTANAWGAIDPDSGTTYVYSEYYGQEAVPVIHAEAIKSRGAWIPGAIDPASRGRGQDDGRALMDTYEEHGLTLKKADNAVETWLWNMLEAMQAGKLKIFKTCTNIQREFRMYRRDEQGKVVKKDDHVLDALRYMYSTGRDIAISSEPQKQAILKSTPSSNTRRF